MTTRGRRVQGEGSIYQKCETRLGCPAKVDGERPKHPCRGRWFGEVDFGHVGNKRVRRTVSAKTKKDLLPRFSALKAEADSGVMTTDSTVAEWMTYWLDNVVGRRNKPATMRNYRSKSDNWIVPHLGAYRLTRLQPQHIRALLNTMEDAGSSPASVRHVRTLLGSALEQAVKDRVLPYNPARSVDPPSVPKSTPDKFTVAQAKEILAALAEREDRARWTVALLSGLRQGEALGLQWPDVDLVESTISVERAAQRITGRGIVLVSPKSESSVRLRPMVELTRFALEQMPTRSLFVFGGDAPRDAKDDSAAWHKMLADIGMEQKPLKAARATTASLLQAAKVHPKTISEILGHAQMSTTDKHYMAGEMAVHREAMARLGELIGS